MTKKRYIILLNYFKDEFSFLFYVNSDLINFLAIVGSFFLFSGYSLFLPILFMCGRRVSELEALVDRVEENAKAQNETLTARLHDKMAESTNLRLENERLKVSLIFLLSFCNTSL